jgi:transglutaminase-like putative cysteine protease
MGGLVGGAACRHYAMMLAATLEEAGIRASVAIGTNGAQTRGHAWVEAINPNDGKVIVIDPQNGHVSLDNLGTSPAGPKSHRSSYTANDGNVPTLSPEFHSADNMTYWPAAADGGQQVSY